MNPSDKKIEVQFDNLNEKLFNICIILSTLAALIFAAMGVLVRLDSSYITLSLFFCVICVLLFFLQSRFHKTKLFTYILLILCNFIVFPLIMIMANFNVVEIPLYYIVGLMFSFVLLKGKERVVFASVQLIIDFGTLIYCNYFDRSNLVLGNEVSLFSTYARIECAIFFCSTICGILIFVRNHAMTTEFSKRENASKRAEMVSLAKDMFLVNVSHEIRTPLNAIIGTTEVILDSDSNNHVKEMAYNISNSSHALLSITSDLLDFSRMNVDTLNLVEAKYDLAMMLNDIVNLLNVRLLDSKVDFYVDVNPFIPKYLIGDSGKIRQIMINFLSNAIKYTKEGSLTFSVDYEPVDEEQICLKISVSDTGIGIKPENIDKIFEPLHRSGEKDVDRSIEGNGLGLALCVKLSEAMNGKITCESEYGVGSVFYFDVNQKIDIENDGVTCGEVNDTDSKIIYYANGASDLNRMSFVMDKMSLYNKEAFTLLDFIDAISSGEYDYYLIDGSAYEYAKAHINSVIKDWSKLVVISSCNYSYSGEPFEYVITKPVSSLNIADMVNHTFNYAVRKQRYEGEFTASNATILVVDDNLVNLEVASNLLSRFGAKVITAASGKEGLIALESDKCDLVFLDYMMPDMDGIDTLKQIRKIDDPAINNVPVICLTANVVSGAREMFLSEGFNDYLSKPIELDKLGRTLSEFLPKELLVYKV